MNEEAFLTTLAGILQVKPADLSDQFRLAYANWDSLVVMGTVAAIDQHFDRSVRPRELFACATVKDLMDLIRAKLAQP